MDIDEEGYAHLMRVGPSTLDRIRAKRCVHGRRIRGGTKLSSMLKKQIPIRTFAGWDNRRIGFAEIEFVQHDGGNSSGGSFACTLSVTDVSTG